MLSLLLKRGISKSYLFGFTGIWFTQIAVLLSVNGLLWDKATYLIRVLPLLFLLILPSRKDKGIKINSFVILLAFLLLVRILFHLIAEPTMGTSSYIYLFRFLSSIAVPLLIFYYKSIDYERFYIGFVHCVILFVLLGLYFYSDILLSPYRNIHHFTSYQLDELISPLAFAYSGLFILIHALTTHSYSISKIILGALGIYLIVWSGTRSVTISALFIVFVHLSWRLRLVIGFLSLIFFSSIDANLFSNLFGRFVLLYTEIVEGRNIGSYRSAGYQEVLNGLDVFNMWFGYGLELDSTNYVAHSLIFETIQMGGVFGLIILIISIRNTSFKNNWLPFRYLYLSRLITGIISNSILDPLTWYFLFFLRKNQNKSK